MKTLTKRMTALALALGMLLCLSACGDDTADITLLVQGNIDVIYQGKYDPEYLKLVGSTEAEAEQDYLDGLEIEAEYFTYYWGIVEPEYGETYEDLDESLRNEIVELYREIYSHSSYEVQEAVKQNDGSYTVKVVVNPIDIMQQASDLYDNDGYEPLNAFWEKSAALDFSTMTDEEYRDYTHEYANIIVQMVKDLLPELGYTESKSLAIQVGNEDGINDDDWGIFDEYVIYYP